MLVGGPGASRSQPAWRQAYRALQHGTARQRCEHQGIIIKFPDEIQDFAERFADMQKKRHEADYDPDATFFKMSFKTSRMQRMLSAASTVFPPGTGVPLQFTCCYLSELTKTAIVCFPLANIPTVERQASGIVNMSVTYAPRGLAVLPNGMLLHLFFLRKNMESPRKFYADLFSPDGEWLLTAYLSELETSSTYPILHVDTEGYIYQSAQTLSSRK